MLLTDEIIANMRRATANPEGNIMTDTPHDPTGSKFPPSPPREHNDRARQAINNTANAALAAVGGSAGCSGAEVVVITRAPSDHSQSDGAICIAWTGAQAAACGLLSAASKAVNAASADEFDDLPL